MKTSNVGLPSLLFLVFVVLKLTGYITWSWWWVTAPLWIGAGISFLLLFFVLAVAAIAESNKPKF